MLLANESILSSNDSSVYSTDDDHVSFKRSYLYLSKIKLTVAGGILDYSDVRVTDGAYLHLTESGSTSYQKNTGTYTFSYVQVEKNGTIVFDYSCLAVPSVLRKRIFSGLAGVLLKVENVLKVETGGRILSDGEGMNCLNYFFIYAVKLMSPTSFRKHDFESSTDFSASFYSQNHQFYKNSNTENQNQSPNCVRGNTLLSSVFLISFSSFLPFFHLLFPSSSFPFSSCFSFYFSFSFSFFSLFYSLSLSFFLSLFLPLFLLPPCARIYCMYGCRVQHVRWGGRRGVRG